MAGQFLSAEVLEYKCLYQNLSKEVARALTENVFSWTAGEKVSIPIGTQYPSTIVSQVVTQYQKRGFVIDRKYEDIAVHGPSQLALSNLDLEPCFEPDASKHIFITAYGLLKLFLKWRPFKDAAVEKIDAKLNAHIEEWYNGSNIFVNCELESDLAEVLVKIYTKNGFKCSIDPKGLLFSRNKQINI